MTRLPLALLALATLPFVAGCGLQDTPGIMHLTLTAAAGLNPGQGGTANPAQVRVYALKNPEKFNNADYFQLADKEQAALGEDLLGREAFTMRPGETRTVDSVVKPGERFVGVTVAYRAIDRSTWRAIIPVRGRATVSVGESRVTVSDGR